MRSARDTTWHCIILLASSALQACTEGETREERDASACARKVTEYVTFLDAHDSCRTDDDCAVVGDCSHADFDPVRQDALAEATRMKLALCENAFDGPVFRPVCVDGACNLVRRTDTCCGCPPDAGPF